MTSQEDVFIREVDEDVQQDRMTALLRRYGPLLAAAAVLLVVIVGAAEVIESRREASRAEAAEAYARALDEGASADALLQFASAADGGYQGLARMRAAALMAREGERRSAIETYALVYGADDLPAALRDLARVRAGYLALEDGGPAADDLVSGVTSEALLPFAREVTALSAMAREDYRTAAAAFRAVAASETAPPGLRSRAGTLGALAEAGEAGVALVPTSDPDDFLAEFGRTLTSGALSEEVFGAETPDAEDLSVEDTDGAAPEGVPPAE